MRVALVVGHKSSSGGASSPDGVSEYQYNDDLVYRVASLLYLQGDVDTHVIHRSVYSDLPFVVNKKNPDIIISFHCNAYNTKVSGTETLYHHKSIAGQHLAAVLQHAMVKVLGLPDRGLKPKTSEDRGGYLLRYTKAPCVIIEPFFIDNPGDYQKGIELKEELANALAGSITGLQGEY